MGDACFTSTYTRCRLSRCIHPTTQYTPSAEEPPLPDKIGHYHTLYPLEDLAGAESAGVSAAWGVRTTCLKGISSRDGHAYCLRVVCGKQVQRERGVACAVLVLCGLNGLLGVCAISRTPLLLPPPPSPSYHHPLIPYKHITSTHQQVIPSLEMLGVVRAAVDAWSSLLHHPGLLVLLEGFVATELDGSPSLVVTTSYVPGAVTLAQAHLQPTQVCVFDGCV